jgi:hypothetical protein
MIGLGGNPAVSVKPLPAQYNSRLTEGTRPGALSVSAPARNREHKSMTDQALALSLITLFGIALVLGMLSRAGSTEQASDVSLARHGGGSDGGAGHSL